jgi:cyclopropane fatty-acyl-phospholipid synthase-like methyltransferase
MPIILVALFFKVLKFLNRLRTFLLPTPLFITEAFMGSWVSQAVTVAARFRIADRLKGGPREARDLAAEIGADPYYLMRLMRFLATHGIFKREKNGLFSLGQHGAGLLSHGPDSFRSFAEMNGSAPNWKSQGALEGAVKRGEPGFDLVFGQGYYEYTEANPAYGKIFDDAMVENSRMSVPFVVASAKFPPQGTVVDIGGGTGTTLVAVLKKYPQLRGILYELPGVAKKAPEYLNAEGVLDRCQIVAGNMFEDTPPKADVYILKAVLHNWGDDHCQTILTHIRKSIGPSGRVLIAEFMVTENGDYHLPVTMDILMMGLKQGGKVRSKEEFKKLFRQSGFKLKSITPTAGLISIIEAVPVE